MHNLQSGVPDLGESLGEQEGFEIDLNCDNVGKFLRSAGSEFQRDGAMKLKECSPKDFTFCLGFVFVTFLLKFGENKMVGKCRGIKKDTEVETLRNGSQSELQSYNWQQNFMGSQ